MNILNSSSSHPPSLLSFADGLIIRKTWPKTISEAKRPLIHITCFSSQYLYCHPAMAEIELLFPFVYTQIQTCTHVYMHDIFCFCQKPEEPGELWSMGLQRVGHDWATELIDWLTDWGKNTRVGYHFLFQWIFSTQGLNLTLLPCSWILYYWDTREALTSLFIFSIILHEWNYPLCTLPVHFLSLL